MLTLAIALAVTLVALICWVELRRDSPAPAPKHSLDCMDWSRRGVVDPYCTAPHATDHFSTAREQVELLNAFDGQIGVRHDR